MAESSSGPGEGGKVEGNWWSGWIQSAKEKSAQTYEYLKKDLSEFKNVCATETSSIVASTSQTLQETINADHTASGDAVKKGITNILGGITNMLTIPPEDDDDDAVLRVSSSGNLEVFDKAKARLYEIQVSVQTYCTEPDGPDELFEEWKSTFDLDTKKAEISELLVSLVEVRSIYTKLVPSAVSQSDFWERYYYKVHQLELDEKRKAALKTRADQFQLGETSEQQWEDDWDDDAVVDYKIPQLTNKKPLNKMIAPPSSDSPDIGDLPRSEPIASTISSRSEDKKLPEIAEPTIKVDSGQEVLTQTNNDATTRDTHPSVVDNSTPNPSDAEQVDVTAGTAQTTDPASLTAEAASRSGDIKTIAEEESTSSDMVKEIAVKEKGEYMMVGSDKTTPASSIGSATKEVESSSGLDDEWEKELFGGDDLKVVQELAEKIGVSGPDKNGESVQKVQELSPPAVAWPVNSLKTIGIFQEDLEKEGTGWESWE